MTTQENIPYTVDEIKAMVKTCEKYNKALERAKDMLTYKEVRQEDMEYLFPELMESKDEMIKHCLIEHIKCNKDLNWSLFQWFKPDTIISWLEKQSEPKDKDELAKGLLIQVATSIMNWLDANTTKGEKCLSNMECEDIETAVRNADWNKVYAYMKKKLEKSALSYRDIDKKVDELVDEFSHTEIGGYGRPGPIEIDAYRKGMNDAIRSIYEYNKIQI